MQATFVRYLIDLKSDILELLEVVRNGKSKAIRLRLKIYVSVLPTVGNDDYGFPLNEHIDGNNGTEGNSFITDVQQRTLFASLACIYDPTKAFCMVYVY